MAFAGFDELVAGMTGGAYRLPISRSTLAAQVAGSEASLWRASGYPAQGAIPAAATICNAATVGAMALAPRAGAQERIISGMAVMGATIGQTLLVEDRLAHMGGLSGTLTTAQTVAVDLFANIGTNNLAERIGAADYSEVEWYFEWYTATGATVSTPTAQVTYHDGTTGSVNIWGPAGAVALPATVGASRRYKIAPTNGKWIRSIQTATLSASTATAGSFGVTALRRLADATTTIANSLQPYDWSVLTAPKIADNACLSFGQVCITTSTGALSGMIKQAVA